MSRPPKQRVRVPEGGLLDLALKRLEREHPNLHDVYVSHAVNKERLTDIGARLGVHQSTAGRRRDEAINKLNAYCLVWGFQLRVGASFDPRMRELFATLWDITEEYTEEEIRETLASVFRAQEVRKQMDAGQTTIWVEVSKVAADV